MAHFTVIKDGIQLYIATKHDDVSYELVDGLQVKSTVTAESKIQNMLQAGESYLVGAYPVTQFKIVNGEPVELTEQEQAERQPPKKPNPKQLVYNLSENLAIAGLPTTDNLPKVINWSKADAKNAIDQASGRARTRFVSQGNLQDMEYQLAERQVSEWRSAGSPENDIPDSLNVWATASGMTVELAAQNIETTAAQWQAALLGIRSLRLLGKAAVEAEQGDYIATAQTYISQLDAL